MVLDHQKDYGSLWEAIVAINAKIDCTAESLRRWVRQAERDQGTRLSPMTSEGERIRRCVQRARQDAILCGEVRRVWDENWQVYGARKV